MSVSRAHFRCAKPGHAVARYDPCQFRNRLEPEIFNGPGNLLGVPGNLPGDPGDLVPVVGEFSLSCLELRPGFGQRLFLGLDAGANDYVTKPFKFAVLLARIRAQLRQHEQSEDAVFTIGPYTFKPASKLLVDEKGGKVRLTEKETAILKYLYRTGDKVVSRETLLHEVWGYNAGVTTHTLETHIYRLRQKIEKDPSNAEILVTETGGYKLSA